MQDTENKLEQIQEDLHQEKTAAEKEAEEKANYEKALLKLDEAMIEIPEIEMVNIVDLKAVRKENLIHFLNSRTTNYMNSMVMAHITLPTQIKYNQMIIKDLQVKREKINKEDPLYDAITATLAETVTQIISSKEDIQNRLDNAAVHHIILQEVEKVIEKAL